MKIFVAGQRLLHAHQEPDRLSCRHSADALFQSTGMWKDVQKSYVIISLKFSTVPAEHQLRCDRRGDGARAEPRLRRPGQGVRRGRQHAQLVEQRHNRQVQGAQRALPSQAIMQSCWGAILYHATMPLYKSSIHYPHRSGSAAWRRSTRATTWRTSPT